MAEAYQASPALERFIVDAAPLHYVTDDAPSTYAELKPYYDALVAGDPIPVYDGGSAYSIYSQPSINHAWRAYHDGIHLVHELGFNLEDEMQACEVQIGHMKQYSDEYDFGEEDYAAVRADIVGQAMYYAKHKRYVTNQAAFVQSCLDRGIAATIETRW